jgi:hypothetical protein
MDTLELDKLLLDIKELKSSVRKANPFLREIMGLKDFAIMSVPLGLVLLVTCLVTHFLISAKGSFEAVPSAWKIVSGALFAGIAIVGWSWKWIAINRRAGQVKEGANFFTVVEAIYGGSWFSISAPLVVSMLVVSLYFALSGHPWLIVSITAIFLGPYSNIVAKLMDRREYLVFGWYLILTGLPSLFFIESAPFLWLAIVWAGTFLVFGAAGLAADKADRGGRP